MKPYMSWCDTLRSTSSKLNVGHSCQLF